MLLIFNIFPSIHQRITTRLRPLRRTTGSVTRVIFQPNHHTNRNFFVGDVSEVARQSYNTTLLKRHRFRIFNLA
ncbi:hypothetical protein SERLA73DRAFT_148029, partial [Serpula lacrymans var. lacrymans S7.3]